MRRQILLLISLSAVIFWSGISYASAGGHMSWISFHNESFLLDTPQPRTLQLGGYFYHSSYSFDEANMDYDFNT
nr:hypothetical protein [Candidatus Delongbacteria bacterium]